MASTATTIRTPRLGRLLAPRPIAGRWRNAARLAFGGFYLAMVTVNATSTLPNTADVYQGLAELSYQGSTGSCGTSSSPWECRSCC